MALSATNHPILGGLRLVPGSRRLILFRVGLVVLVSLPALLATTLGLATGVARQPYFTEVQGRLPMMHLLRLMDDLPGSLAATLALAVVLALLGQQVLVAGALSWLNPAETRGGKLTVCRDLLRTGAPWLGAMLRVVLLAAVCSGAGLLALNLLFKRLSLSGEAAGWTGHTLMVILPALKALLGLLWISLVGAWAFWCRVLMVADGRRVTRSAWVLVLRVWWRHPLRAPLFTVALSLASFIGSGVTLALWRQFPPSNTEEALLLSVTWLLVLILAAMLWHWTLRSARLLYADPSLGDIHARPDGPWGLVRALRWLWGKLRRRR